MTIAKRQESEGSFKNAMAVHRSGTTKIWQSGNEKAEMFCYSMKHQFIAGNSRRGSLSCNRALIAKTFCQNLLHLLRSLSWPGIGSGFRLQRGEETKLVVMEKEEEKEKEKKEEKEEVLESD